MQANPSLCRDSGNIACIPRDRHNVAVPQPYESLEAELYDAFQESHGPSPELALMKAFLENHPGRSLEIGCGSGRLLGPLREAGFEVEGLEISADMIARAEPALQQQIHRGDMDQWIPKEAYASILVPAFTLQLSADPLSTLKHWRGWLRPGGAIYLTTFMPYAELLGEFPEGEWYEDHKTTLPDGSHAVLETRHELQIEQQILIRHHRYRIEQRPDATHECRQRIRWGEPAQWREWMEKAGFDVEMQFLDWDESYFNDAPDPEQHEGMITTLGRVL